MAPMRDEIESVVRDYLDGMCFADEEGCGALSILTRS